MQYLLTEEEYKALTAHAVKRDEAFNAELQRVCTLAADHVPVEVPWFSDGPRPWGCILTNNYDYYCDKCPVQKLCPHPRKEYSQ